MWCSLCNTLWKKGAGGGALSNKSDHCSQSRNGDPLYEEKTGVSSVQYTHWTYLHSRKMCIWNTVYDVAFILQAYTQDLCPSRRLQTPCPILLSPVAWTLVRLTAAKFRPPSTFSVLDFALSSALKHVNLRLSSEFIHFALQMTDFLITDNPTKTVNVGRNRTSLHSPHCVY